MGLVAGTGLRYQWSARNGSARRRQRLMSAPDTVHLDRRPRLVANISRYILSRAEGRSVLNVGAAGGVATYLPDQRELWLHHRLAGAARELVGIDIDADAIAHAARHGVEIVAADCEEMALGRRFEVIVMSDVIEHLDRPGQALQVLMRHLAPGGRLIVTTPNPTYAGTLARALLNRRLNVYHDHVAAFLPEHLAAACNRHGWRLAELGFFGNLDRRSPGLRLKSALMVALGRLAPRLSGWFVAVIEAPAGGES